MKRNITEIKISFNKKTNNTEAYIKDDRIIEHVIICSGVVAGYTLLNTFKASDMLDLNIDYYSLGFREKHILDNLKTIKKSKDFSGGFIFSSVYEDIIEQNEAFIVLNDKIIG